MVVIICILSSFSSLQYPYGQPTATRIKSNSRTYLSDPAIKLI